ncbi:hypothetical protein L218DRAFT_997232 [Marasmius fiardii PR-910]|nr:hypothetical protein L218DRAFT_997232 [Marasmius fiardii PR-910]
MVVVLSQDEDSGVHVALRFEIRSTSPLCPIDIPTYQSVGSRRSISAWKDVSTSTITLTITRRTHRIHPKRPFQISSVGNISPPEVAAINLRYLQDDEKRDQDCFGYLTLDVILVVTATGLDSPPYFIEAHPSPEHDTVAIGLTFVPRFKPFDVLNGVEYIFFLADRSGKE